MLHIGQKKKIKTWEPKTCKGTPHGAYPSQVSEEGKKGEKRKPQWKFNERKQIILGGKSETTVCFNLTTGVEERKEY